MKPAQGIVSTHAQTIRPATPQRTAESLRVAPDADDRAGDRVRRRHRDAERGREEQRHRAAGLGAEAADRLQLGDLHAHRLHDAPAAGERAETHRRLAGEHDPERNVGIRVKSGRATRGRPGSAR